jgi:hypothetical protein
MCQKEKGRISFKFSVVNYSHTDKGLKRVKLIIVSKQM